VDFRELKFSGAFEITPKVFGDSRGYFYESLRVDKLSELIGRDFRVMQGNTSHSSRGVVRGIHFAQVPNGQAKYVSVLSGRIADYVVDIRLGSPTFGQWECVELSSVNNRSLFIPEGLGHAFVALEDDTVVNYLVSDVYRPEREHGVNPMDPKIGLTFDFPVEALSFSQKDLTAPSLDEAESLNLLPTFETVNSFIESRKAADN